MARKPNQDAAAGRRSHARPANRSTSRRGISSTAKLRDEYGLSRPTLARMLAVAEATLEKWEAGKMQPTTEERAKYPPSG